jgi:predicted MFS family arabinose efflux permease
LYFSFSAIGIAAMSAPGRNGIVYIVGHYLVTSFGYFGMLATLVVILNSAMFGTADIAVLVATFGITNRVAKIPLAPWLDRMPAAHSVLLGCTLAACGFGGLYLASGLAYTAAALVVAGTGIAINGLATKQLAAAASDLAAQPARVFSMINIAVNVSSAIAAPAALLLLDHRRHEYVTLLIGAIYLAAGAITWLNFSSMPVEPRGLAPLSLRTYLDVLRAPGLRGFLLINAFGWFLYGQLFNVMALHVSGTLGLASQLGWLYTLNALLVVALQMGVTSLSNRLSKGNPLGALSGSYAIYLLAFVAAWAIRGYAGMVAMVILFTVAEMVFIPTIDVMLLKLVEKNNRAIGYSLLAISIATGESLGAACGMTAYRHFAALGHSELLWLAVAGMALLFIAATSVISKLSGGLAAQAAQAAAPS